MTEAESLGAQSHLCAGCRSQVNGDSRSWVFIRMISRSVTTVWLCEECAPRDASVCAVCASRAPVGRIPLCAECLFEYEAALRDEVNTGEDLEERSA
jgi:hypothetical protein